MKVNVFTRRREWSGEGGGDRWEDVGRVGRVGRVDYIHLTSRFPSHSEGYGSKLGKMGGLMGGWGSRFNRITGQDLYCTNEAAGIVLRVIWHS
jgi:hypothetical protein